MYWNETNQCNTYQMCILGHASIYMIGHCFWNIYKWNYIQLVRGLDVQLSHTGAFGGPEFQNKWKANDINHEENS